MKLKQNTEERVENRNKKQRVVFFFLIYSEIQRHRYIMSDLILKRRFLVLSYLSLNFPSIPPQLSYSFFSYHP